jgi:hypothetical protein
MQLFCGSLKTFAYCLILLKATSVLDLSSYWHNGFSRWPPHKRVSESC